MVLNVELTRGIYSDKAVVQSHNELRILRISTHMIEGVDNTDRGANNSKDLTKNTIEKKEINRKNTQVGGTLMHSKKETKTNKMKT